MTDAEIEDGGGVRALRAWVMAATKRALRLYPPGTPNADPNVYDSSIAELEELLRLLEHDAELRATVTVQLGSVLTMRHLARGGVPRDRERARLLLREARDPRTGTGAATDADDRRWAALALLSLAMPIPPAGGGVGQAGFFNLLDWRAYQETEEMAAIAAEMPALLAEALELPLAPELRGRLQRMSTIPDPSGSQQGRARTSVAADDDPDVVAMDAMMPSALDALAALRGGDPEAINRALRRLRAAHGKLPPGHEASVSIENFIGMLLQAGESVGGNLQDQSLGHEYVTALADQMQSFAAASTTPVTAEFAVAVRVYPLMSRIDAAYKAEDAATVRALLGELEALEA
ncbi:hypothetical protein AB4Z54_07760, partial [Streptomyces sp. MCAF7]